MTQGPWKEPTLPDANIQRAPWRRANHLDAKEIQREAMRYCPEFPFRPEPQETFSKDCDFYEDYRLVRVASTSGAHQTAQLQEVFGFYAPGDFRPLDGLGKTLEVLNKIVPLRLTAETVMDYALLRLRFELHDKFVDRDEVVSGWRRAEIVSELDDLPLDKGQLSETALATLANLLAKPQIEAIPTEDRDQPQENEPEQSHRVWASAVIYSETTWRLMRLSVQISLNGMLTWDQKHERSHPFPLGSDKAPTPVVLSPLRTRTAMPIREWNHLGDTAEPLPETLRRKIGNQPELWYAKLRDTYGAGQDPNVRRVIIRVADLSFYRTFCLLEVLERLQESYRRSYALIRQHEGNLDVRPLDGTSPPIHSVNAEDDKPIIHDNEAEEYLRFFCWAVHAGEGPFYVPREIRELSFVTGPTPDQMRAVRELYSPGTGQFPITDEKLDNVEYLDAKSVHKKACFLYSTQMEDGWFSIEWTGMVTMDEDKVRVEDLAIDAELYGKGNLFALTIRPQPRHYLQDTTAQEPEPPKIGESVTRGAADKADATEASTAHESNSTAKPKEFWQEIDDEGTVSGQEINEPIVFDDARFSGEEGNGETS